MSTKQHIMDMIKLFFDCGRSKNFSVLRTLNHDDPQFSSFSETHPYGLNDYNSTMLLLELKFANISDYEYEINNIKLDIFNNTAIAVFELHQYGLSIDNTIYSCKQIDSETRVTFVFTKNSTAWKIIHIHMSSTN